MAVVAGTYLRGQVIGVKEDLQDVIFNISPIETPLITMCEKMKARNTFHEWQTDALAGAADNRQIGGDDASFSTPTPRTRLGNYLNISRKTVSVSGTVRAVDIAGADDELAYLVTKLGRELKRDMEYALVRNNASSAGSDTVARSSAGLESWLTVFTAASGSSGSPATPGYSGGTVAAPTDATVAGTFNEADLKSAIQKCWSVGGQPSVIMAGPFNKQKLSAFSGNVTGNIYWRNPEDPGVINAAVDVYVSDFGKFKIIPNRYQRDRTVFLLDPDYLAMATLRPITLEQLAKTGDADKRMLITEYGLCVKNPEAHAKVTDLTTTGAI